MFGEHELIMGNHYVPRYYLRGFSPGFGTKVWVYDRKERRKFETNIINIGHENNLYPDELEATLSEEIEGPANDVLDKIRNHQELTSKDKVSLSLYLVTLWKRVPEGKRRLRQRMPEISTKVGSGIHAEIERLIMDEPELREAGLKRKEEVDEILARYRENPPDAIWHQAILSEPTTSRIVKQIAQMNWVFFRSQNNMCFLTCDNPVFFFESLGVGNANSELSFPISGEIALWATNRKILNPGYYRAPKAIIKEFNRRSAHNCTRFVFSGANQEWIENFVFKKAWCLNSIL